MRRREGPAAGPRPRQEVVGEQICQIDPDSSTFCRMPFARTGIKYDNLKKLAEEQQSADEMDRVCFGFSAWRSEKVDPKIQIQRFRSKDSDPKILIQRFRSKDSESLDLLYACTELSRTGLARRSSVPSA